LQEKLEATSEEAVGINVAHASLKPGNRAGLTQLKEEGAKVTQQQELFVAQINAIGGAIQENKYWIEFAENISDEDNQWVNRQHLEIRQRGIVNKQKESVGLLNKVNGQMLAVIQELKPKNLQKTERNRLTKKRNKLADERGKHNGITNALSGAVQENKRWILYVDQMLSGDTTGLGPESEEVVVQIVTPE
jgi:flagellar biosynthesis regulator FlaF